MYFKIYENFEKLQVLEFRDIPQSGLIIGSDPQSHILLPNVSPQQALIYYDSGKLRIRNLNPNIKMKLNDTVIGDSLLNYGDRIQIGNYTINIEEVPYYEFEDLTLYKIATKWRRFFNYLIDSLFLGFIEFLIYFITIGINPEYPLILLFIEGAVITFFYYFILESTTQKTLGKFLTKTLVVTEDFEEPTVSQIALRTICRFIPFDPLSYLFTQVGWHDSLSNTRVVYKK